MRMAVCVTPQGLVPWGECDYEIFKRLREGDEYYVDVKISRNGAFHRKYMKLFSVAWEYLTEKQQRFFKGNIDVFRKTIEVSAGHCDMIYSIERREWVEVPKSVSFSSLEQKDFEELYERVKDILFATALKNISEEEFNKNLIDF